MHKMVGISCYYRGKLRDTVLDWEDALPAKEIESADYHSKYIHNGSNDLTNNYCLLYCCRLSDLSICLGTTLQIVPAGKLPLLAKKNEGGKMVLCNLQHTRYVRMVVCGCM